MSPNSELDDMIAALLLKVPEPYRAVAADLLAQYGTRFFAMAREDAWQYLRRLMAGDMEAVVELDAKLSDDEFLAKVKANTALWANVAQYNKVRDEMREALLLRLAPVILALLLAVVGL